MKTLKYILSAALLLMSIVTTQAQELTACVKCGYMMTMSEDHTAMHADNAPMADENPNKLKVNFTGTLISRFIWRGLELGDHPHVQPEVTFSTGNFFFGAWASQGIAPVAFDESIAGYKEVIPYVGYNFTLGESAKLTTLIMDHYNPNFGDIGDWKDNGDGGNTLEFRAIFTAGKFDVLGSVNFFNDPDNSTYLEVGYTATLPNNFTVRPLISLTPTKSPFNGTQDFAFTQIGVIASKNIKINDEVMIPVKVDFIVNPELDKFYTALGFGVKF